MLLVEAYEYRLYYILQPALYYFVSHRSAFSRSTEDTTVLCHYCQARDSKRGSASHIVTCIWGEGKGGSGSCVESAGSVKVVGCGDEGEGG